MVPHWPASALFCMALDNTEIKNVVKLLEKDWNGATSTEVATAIVEAINDRRNARAKFASVGRIMLPNGEWHNFALAPYPTLLQAQRAGEGWAHDPVSKTGTGNHRAVPIVANVREAWNSIRPEHVDEKQWIREQISSNMTGLTNPDAYRERSGW
jgi:hypothetical protein